MRAMFNQLGEQLMMRMGTTTARPEKSPFGIA
jgi:hypothetical protein